MESKVIRTFREKAKNEQLPEGTTSKVALDLSMAPEPITRCGIAFSREGVEEVWVTNTFKRASVDSMLDQYRKYYVNGTYWWWENDQWEKLSVDEFCSRLKAWHLRLD